MHAHVLQHVPYEGIGSIAAWLRDHDAAITWTHLYRGETPTAPDGLDLLVIMGGPMSVHDLQDHPWLPAEKQLLRRALAAGIPTLGICLGAQLIADVLGAPIGSSPETEIGWFPIQSVDEHPPAESFRFPPEMTVFHWHGESFGIPDGAHRLAASPGCPNQAFQHGPRTIGLQFHLETTPQSARDIVENSHPLVPSACVQSAEDILNAPEMHYQGANALMRAVLDYLTEQPNQKSEIRNQKSEI